MSEFFSVQNVLLLLVTAMQAGQWVQRQLSSDYRLGEKLDALTKQMSEIRLQLKEDYVFRNVYQSDQHSLDRRVQTLERHVLHYVPRGGDEP